MTIAVYLPDTVIGLVPNRLQMVEQGALQFPTFFVGAELAVATLVHRVHNLAVDIDLQLSGGSIADATGLVLS